MRPFLVFLLAACSPLLSSCLALSAPERHPPRLTGARNVLFVGNSHTYTNDLPEMVRQLAHAAGDTAVRVASIAHPDYALEDHYHDGVVQQALDGSPWRWVVLQQGTSALPASQVHLQTWTRALAPNIRAAGAEPVLYQIWPMRSRRFDAEAALTSYATAAEVVGGLLAPAGDAFTAALDAVPSIDPYAADGLHANRLGTYLAALVLLERMLGIAPESLPPRIPGAALDSAHVRQLQAAARVALDRTPARPGATSATAPGTSPAVAASDTSTVRVVHADTTFFAEGLAADERDGTVFVTSIRHRNVLVVPASGATRWLLRHGVDAVGAVLGAALDTTRATL